MIIHADRIQFEDPKPKPRQLTEEEAHRAVNSGECEHRVLVGVNVFYSTCIICRAVFEPIIYGVSCWGIVKS